MFCWRITKYNPQFRNASGNYTKDEWTSFSDIGVSCDNKKLSFEDYKAVEDAYIATILLFMDCVNISTMKAVGLEKFDTCSFDSQEAVQIFHQIANNDIIDKEMVACVSRMALREDLWCKLESDVMYVHFGYDYYMYIGVSATCNITVNEVEKMGLFIEPYKSPYLE